MTATTRRWIRIAFAGPGAVLIALVMMAGMALWLPGGAAGIDNLVAPLIWAGLFFHACLDSRLWRVAIVALGMLLIHSALIADKYLDKSAASTEAHR